MVFSLCGRRDGGRGAGAAGKADGPAVRPQDLRRMGNVLADTFELLAECHDRDEIRRLEHARLQRLAAQRIPQRRHRRKSKGAQTTERTRYICNGKRRSSSDAL